MPTNFQINQVYSFKVYPAALLGDGFQNVTIAGVVDAETANQFVDIQALHQQIYPSLPAGTPSDPFKYTYLKIKRPGQTGPAYLAVPWIKDDTVIGVEALTMVITCGPVEAADEARARAALVRNNIPVQSIEFK